MAKKSNAWRPTVMTPEVIAKLEYWFSKGFSDSEACLYANISKDSLYRYIDVHPGFWDRKELLKDQPKLKAKLNITEKIDEGDDYNSRWYLERKSKDEFSLKVENDNNNLNADVTENLDEEQKKKLAGRFGKLYK